MPMNPVSQSILDAAFTNFDSVFQQAYSETPVNWDKIAMLKTSDTDKEVFHWLANLPEMREWLGERQIVNLKTRAYELVNKKFERTFGLAREAFDDDKIGAYADDAAMLGEVARQWPDKEVVDALVAGETAETFDGVPYFSASHPVDINKASAGTQANLHTAKPLNAENYAAVRASARTIKGDNGVAMSIVPNLLVVPPQLEVTARTLINADVIPSALSTGSGGASKGTAGQTNILKGTAEVVVLDRLADDATSWYLMHAGRRVKPLVWQLRDPPEFNQLTDSNGEHVFLNDEYVFGVRARGVAGYGPWWLAHKVKAS